MDTHFQDYFCSQEFSRLVNRFNFKQFVNNGIYFHLTISKNVFIYFQYYELGT